MRTFLLALAVAVLPFAGLLTAAQQDAGPAKIVVTVPADAKVFIDGKPTNSTGATRTYVTPPLTAGQEYQYEIKVTFLLEGKPQTQTKSVTVSAGKTSPISFGDLGETATVTGHVYTINNDVKENGIAVLKQLSNGKLVEIAGSPFATGGKGLGGGDINEQGAIRIQGEFVLAVNPGSDTIAVFKKSKGGKLTPVPGSPFSSGGSTPVSLTIHGDLVYVANQAAPFANPTGEPNLMGFRLEKDGKLTPIAKSKIMFPEGQGPAQVEFSPNGETVVATSGFQGDKTNRVHSYLVQEDGTLKEGPGSPLEPKGATGVVGFSWDPMNNRVYVSNFKGSAVIVFDIDKKTGGLKQNGTPYSDKEEAACWTAISKDGSKLYVANFVSNSISTFQVHADGKLTLLGTAQRRAMMKPDTKDLMVSKDGKYLYAVGSAQREISIFQIGANGMLTELPAAMSPITLKKGQNITGLATD